MRVPVPYQHLVWSCFFSFLKNFSHSNWCVLISHCSFNLTSLMIKHLFMCLLAICVSFVKCLFILYPTFELHCKSFYILDMSLFWYMCCQYLLLAFGLPFHFLNDIYQRAEVLNFDEIQFIIFFLIDHTFCVLRNLCPK